MSYSRNASREQSRWKSSCDSRKVRRNVICINDCQNVILFGITAYYCGCDILKDLFLLSYIKCNFVPNFFEKYLMSYVDSHLADFLIIK